MEPLGPLPLPLPLLRQHDILTIDDLKLAPTAGLVGFFAWNGRLANLTIQRGA